MNGRTTRDGLQVIALAVLGTTVVAGCASVPILFPGATNVSELAPDDRVVIGLIRYTNGDLSKSLPGSYQESWPRFTYDLQHVQGPQYATRIERARFGPQGGIFAFRAKQRTLYLDSIMASTSKWYTNTSVLWTVPVALKLPANGTRCAYVGTILVDLSGDVPDYPYWPWSAKTAENTHVKVTVVDDYDRDRAVLAGYVAGCDPQRALAEAPTKEELLPLIEAALAAQKAEEDRRKAEAARIGKKR